MWDRLLLIEDHDDFRESVREHLEKQGLGFRIIEADSGEVGVAMALRERPHIVLMDIRLPGMDGMEAARRIKAQLPETVIIVLTMFETDAFKRLFDSDDVSAYIGKSELYNKLVPTIKSLSGESKSKTSSR